MRSLDCAFFAGRCDIKVSKSRALAHMDLAKMVIIIHRLCQNNETIVGRALHAHLKCRAVCSLRNRPKQLHSYYNCSIAVARKEP